MRADAKARRRPSRTRAMRAGALGCVVAVLWVGLGAEGRAQESGGSFGGSSWDEPSGGGGGGGGGGSGGGSSGTDWAEQQRREREERAERERREEEERRRREEEERRRREEEERRRREEEERRARERARKLALPPMERARELSWPASPPRPSVAARGLDAPLAPERPPPSSWTTPSPVPPLAPAPTASLTGPFDWGAVPCCGVPLFVILLPLAWLLTRTRSASTGARGVVSASRSGPAATGPGLARGAPNGRAFRISIAFDWTARAALQAALAAMAKRHDMRSRAGLHAAAVEMAALLAQHAGAARYMTWELATGDARTWFQSRANDLRARFSRELVRNQSAEEAQAYAAKEHEGQGLVVVSVLVASKLALGAPPGEIAPAALAAVLGAIRQLRPDETQALEVIWSPAAENDRMSSYELEQRYPELQRTADGVGRVQCGYCAAPFPRELGRCPACGGPVG